MAYADPQSVTTSAANTLPRVGSGVGVGSFSNPDGTVQLSVSHQNGKRVRRQARVSISKISADPLLTNVNVRLSASAYIVVDVPNQGFTLTEQTQLITGLTTWLTAATNANAIKLLGGEN
ncbi:coat protein [ssRNA phage Esthiorhiza.1_11]|uniref:Coat protein n=2 Tax=Leviviricetes TaxID=2842243 RepID=A0A8S5KYG4_9VIRU|nr:coat protein [ssRNA phage Esthiorhiza.1_11]QDH90717.1 MAG: hypothetical protein H1RhizoLitter1485_000002 [Leviviridae sp.]DAD49930.1 TPA_asm: coat protein [ssRNA phage Esthiorhiza.1_11]